MRTCSATSSSTCGSGTRTVCSASWLGTSARTCAGAAAGTRTGARTVASRSRSKRSGPRGALRRGRVASLPRLLPPPAVRTWMEPTVPDEERPLELDPLRPPSPLTWRDRVADARELVATPGRALACAALAVGVAVAAFAVLRPAPAGPAPELSIPMASSGPSAASASPVSTQPATLVVHAAGAVNAPGLYTLPAGSRVNDVVAAAGGLSAGADSNRINLAAPVADGERVYIPKVGEAVPAAEGPSAEGSESSRPVNLNTATVEELDALPGIGPSIAQAIVDERERNGPFRSVDDLERVRGIGPSKLDQLRDLVTV